MQCTFVFCEKHKTDTWISSLKFNISPTCSGKMRKICNGSWVNKFMRKVSQFTCYGFCAFMKWSESHPKDYWAIMNQSEHHRYQGLLIEQLQGSYKGPNKNSRTFLGLLKDLFFKCSRTLSGQSTGHGHVNRENV